MSKSWIYGWRTFLVQLGMVVSVTWVALSTASVELVTAVGGVFAVIHGSSLWGKKVQGEQAIRKNGGG